ncbi:MAG: site-specific integrase [Muribaculaceae bacterium]|nr:site-specific integrase [Muribaculaceae bacterium]
MQYLRTIYSIIENRINTTAYPSIDEIADDFRLAMKGDPSMKAMLKRAQEDFPVRADWVSIGNEYKRDFQFIYPEAQVLPDKLLEYITLLSQQAKNNGKESMSRSYNSTRSSLSKFLNEQDVQLNSIDKHFVTQYSTWLKENGVIDSTQSFYLRTLRAILNRAKEDGIETNDDDMFKGINTRVKFSEKKRPRATISREILNKIQKLKFQDNPEAEVARDMFMFAFYCRGMELTDVMNLTYLNIKGDILTYNRRGVGRPRVVTLDKLAINIIKKYRNTSGYIFPIKEIYKGNQQYSVNERVRRHIKDIGKAVGFPELTFSMNISAWEQLMSQLNISELLLKCV